MIKWARCLRSGREADSRSAFRPIDNDIVIDKHLTVCVQVRRNGRSAASLSMRRPAARESGCPSGGRYEAMDKMLKMVRSGREADLPS